jgi:hypothetical protein
MLKLTNVYLWLQFPEPAAEISEVVWCNQGGGVVITQHPSAGGQGLLVGRCWPPATQVYAVNPQVMGRYRGRQRPARAKSDRGDAKVLADLVRTDRHNHRQVAGDSPLAEAVKVLARAHQSLIWTRQRHVNALRSALREFYPGRWPRWAPSWPSRRPSRCWSWRQPPSWAASSPGRPYGGRCFRLAGAATCRAGRSHPRRAGAPQLAASEPR